MVRLPPVYSPISLGAITGAIAAAMVGASVEVRALRQLLLERFSADDVLLTASGTSALQVALGLLPENPRGERAVAMPAYSCYDLVTAANGADFRIRFYEVDPGTLSVDLPSLRAAVAEGVSGVVAANLYGYPLDWPGIRSITDEAGIPVIEDAAQGLGTAASAGGGGSLGDLTVLSFGRGKGWTGGGGGALLRRGPRAPEFPDPIDEHSGHLARGVRATRSTLVTTAAWALGRPTLYGVPAAIPGLGLGETVYKEPTRPRQLMGFNAALVRRTESSSLDAIAGRREVASALIQALSGADEINVLTPLGGHERASFLRLPVLASSQSVADRLRRDGPRYGVQSGYPKPLHRLRAAQKLTQPDEDSLGGGTALSERLFTLPTHQWIGTSEVEALARLLRPTV